MRRIECEDIQPFRNGVVLRLFVFETAEGRLGADQELEQELPHEGGLELKHVAVEGSCGISMTINFEAKRPRASGVPALCTPHQPEESLGTMIEILVGRHHMGDDYNSCAFFHFSASFTIRRGNMFGPSVFAWALGRRRFLDWLGSPAGQPGAWFKETPKPARLGVKTPQKGLKERHTSRTKVNVRCH